MLDVIKMRSELKAIANKLHNMALNGSTPDIVREVRNREIKKLFEKRQEKRDNAVKKIDAALQEIKAQFNPEPVDDVASLARHLRLSDYYASIPTNKLSKIDLKAVDTRDLPIIGGTCRKRGLHDLADEIYSIQEIRRDEWQHNPYTKTLEKLKVKIDLLHNGTSKDSLYIGEDFEKIDKSDFADVSTTGIITFKDGDREIVV